jgi:hypothetical protein
MGTIVTLCSTMYAVKSAFEMLKGVKGVNK